MSAPGESSAYQAALVDVLGVLAYGQLTAFSRLASDADLAPLGPARIGLARIAAAELDRFDDLNTRLSGLGVDVYDAMRPYVAAFDSYHERTRPNNWLEGLLKAYVGDGIARDFYREVAVYLGPDDRELVQSVVTGGELDDLVVGVINEALEADSSVAGRLALWGRRLLGEALTQAQLVATERDALVTFLLGGGQSGPDLGEVGLIFTRITEAHTHRMGRLGLAA